MAVKLIATSRLYETADGGIVPAGDPKARRLYRGVGRAVPADMVEAHGLAGYVTEENSAQGDASGLIIQPAEAVQPAARKRKRKGSS